MARSVSARRYAQAVYQLAEEKNEVEKWLDDLAVLAASVHDEVFIIFANSPKVESEKKSAPTWSHTMINKQVYKYIYI